MIEPGTDPAHTCSALVIESGAPEAEEASCPHRKIVPINKDWGRCEACGDSTFPLSDLAAGMPVDPDAPPRKKRKSSTSPTQRTLAECRKRGWTAQVVERRLPRMFVTQDLFGVIDVVALAFTIESGRAILGIQATTDANHANRRTKILAEPRALEWLEHGGRLELWSWSKRGAVGSRKLWTLRVEAFTVDDWSKP